MPQYTTSQEQLWSSDFGDAYVERNESPEQLAARTAIFAEVLSRTIGVTSVLELGANVGINLQAIGRLLPRCRRTGVEINEKAYKRLRQLEGVDAIHGSLLDVDLQTLGVADFVFSAGVLIHIAPERLRDVYERLYACSARYICVMEYYSPSPTQIPYRGHTDVLFKRDFAGELMELYPELELVDYGFVYRRDPNFAGDDFNWFLLRKPVASSAAP
jgi:spore coat polysaccharide biosynthesis protein SpsF